jgi:hypothetical protein
MCTYLENIKIACILNVNVIFKVVTAKLFVGLCTLNKSAELIELS